MNLMRIMMVVAICAAASAAETQVRRDCADDADDFLRCVQIDAMAKGKAAWGHWGLQPGRYTGWTNHSNRLITFYTFGVSLDGLGGKQILYRDRERIEAL